MTLIQITAYVRNKDDLAKWKALTNKTGWLHERLNEPPVVFNSVEMPRLLKFTMPKICPGCEEYGESEHIHAEKQA